MATLQLAINAHRARVGANAFLAEVNRIRAGAGLARSSVLGIFSSISAGLVSIKALEDISKFEVSMAQLKAVTEASAIEMQYLEDSARKMGLTSIQSAGEVAEAFVQLAKAGNDAANIVASTPAILQLATAHTMSLEEATRITATTLEQFKLGGDQAQRVVDVLSDAANATSLEVTHLAASMKFAGVTFGATNTQIEEAGAMMTVLAKNSIRGALAGTYLRGVIGQLLKPTRVSIDAFKDLGLSMKQLDPLSRPIVDIFEELNSRGFTLRDAFKAFGKELGNAAFVLVDNVDEIRKYTEEFNNAEGSTKRFSDLIEGTVIGSIKKFRAALFEVSLMIGDAGLTDAVRNSVVWLTDLVYAMAGLDDRIRGNVETMKTWARWIEAVGGGVLGAAFVAAVATATTMVVGFSVAIMATPIGWLAASVAAAIGVFLYFRDTMVVVGDKSGTVTDYVIASWEYVRDFFKIMWPLISQLAADAWNDVVAFSKKTWDILVDTWDFWDSPLGSFFKTLGVVARFTFNNFIALVYSIGDIFDAVISEWKGAFDAFMHYWDGSWWGLVDAADRALNEMDGERMFGRMLDGVKKNFTTDWMSDFGLLATDFGEKFKKNFEEAAAFVGIDPSRYQSISNGVDWIVGRADELRRLREEKEKQDAANLQLMLSEQGVKGAFEEASGATEEYTRLTDDSIEKIEDRTERLRDMIEQYRIEAETVLENADAQEVLRAVREAERIVEEEQIANGHTYIYMLEQQIRLVQQLRAQKYFQDASRDLQTEMQLVNMTNDEREIRRTLIEAERIATEAGLEGQEAYLANLEKEMRELQRLQNLKSLGDDFGRAFSDAFGDIILNAKTATEAINDFGLAVYRMIFNEAVGKPIAGLISGIFTSFASGITGATTASAHGNVMQNGSITPFALGGVSYRPTMRPMASGNALFAENGPEAIMPLTRMADGRLGVASSGESSRAIHVTVNVTTRDEASFRRSTAQVARAAQSAIAMATRRA